MTGYGQKKEFTPYVQSLMGTLVSEQTHAGHALPLVGRAWGGVYFCPQTAFNNADKHIYNYASKKITAFRATRLPSPERHDYGSFSIYPAIGNIIETNEQLRASEYTHTSEVATPYQYKVVLNKFQITTEFTGTERCVYFKFKYPKSKVANLIIDAFEGGSSVKIIPEENKIIGVCRNNGGNTPANFSGFFVAVFSKKFKAGTWAKDSIYNESYEITGDRVGAFLKFASDTSEEIFLKIGTSLISEEQAELNLANEIGNKTYTQVLQESKEEWEKTLGKIEIEGANHIQKNIFYTLLYRTLLFPRMSYEKNEDGNPYYYSPYDGKIHEGFLYSDFGIYDSYRALLPLYSLLFPEKYQEICSSIANVYKHGGSSASWMNGGYAKGSVNTSPAIVFVDALNKGLTKFNHNLAYEASVQDATQLPDNEHLSKEGLAYYKRLGYVPTSVAESVSKTLEYSLGDMAIYQLAKILKKNKDTLWFREKANNYIHHFDAHTLLMRPKNTDGSWLEHFRKYDWGGYYTQGNAWQWTWSVAQDPQGLINLMGGKEPFIAKLDSLFNQPQQFDAHHLGYQSKEINSMLLGKMGQYAHHNIACNHIPYLYTYAGQAWKTHYWCKQILNKLYNQNLDCFAHTDYVAHSSAWYILNSIGIYQANPSQPEWLIGNPMFGKTTLHLDHQKEIIIESNTSANNIYLQSLSLNDTIYSHTYLNHATLMNGAKLKLQFSPTLNKIWGSNEKNLPHSFSSSKSTSIPYTEFHGGYFLNHISVPLHCRTLGAEIRYTTDGSLPNINSALYTKALQFNKNTNLIAQAYKAGLSPGPYLSLRFKNELIQADTTPRQLLQGLKSMYYEDIQHTEFPDFEALNPIKTDTTDRISIDAYKGKDYFGLVLEGYIKFPEDGLYTFFMKNIDEEAKLYIDDEIAIEAHRRHGKHEHRHKLALAKGLHKMRLEYHEIKGNEHLYVGFKHHHIGQHHAHHSEQHEIPASWLFRAE